MATKGAKPVGRKTIKIPVNVQNEQLILSAMMRDKVIMRDLASALDADIFIGKRHQILFGILRDISFERLKFDLEILEQLGRRKEYGGRRYVAELLEAYPEPPKNLEFHLERLRQDSVKFLLRVGPLQDLVDLSEDPNATLDQISEVAQAVQREVARRVRGGVKGGYALYKHYLADLRARRKTSNFVPTGYNWLDESLTEGLARKKLSVWTARPSIGKSTFAWNIADRVANRYGIPVLYLPIEMGEVSTMDGMVSLRSGIHLDKLIKTPHEMTRDELETVNEAAFAITENERLNFYTKSFKFEELPRIINEGGYAVTIFDLWEKLCPSKEQQIIAEYLDKTQTLAKECDTHCMMIHQTKRGVEKRPDKRPTLEDLKNSGAYEETADLCVGLYRECYYNPEVSEDILEVGIMKQRRGGRLNWHYFKFEGHVGRVGEEVRDWGGVQDYD